MILAQGCSQVLEKNSTSSIMAGSVQEHQTGNPMVEGSIPAGGSRDKSKNDVLTHY